MLFVRQLLRTISLTGQPNFFWLAFLRSRHCLAVSLQLFA